jgi:hypothetical protein
MDDPLLMRGLNSICDLRRNRQSFSEWQGTTRDSSGKGRPVDKLEHERWSASASFQAIDRRDVWVVQRSKHSRFPMKPRQSVKVAGPTRW